MDKEEREKLLKAPYMTVNPAKIFDMTKVFDSIYRKHFMGENYNISNEDNNNIMPVSGDITHNIDDFLNLK